ncbi:DUF3089 domain-containing protein [uncultured Hymenobacter sp.]|uniref:DUF3089 domain-containing protein n=1 Tax=uncultured Hymenobacter sp. TaxID=170016 RepID=UPI0035CAF2AC
MISAISYRFGWLAFVLPALLCSCLNIIKPGREYPSYSTPAAPDYAQPTNWAALPTRVDAADVVPTNSGLLDQQATASVDVFFVHPTTYLGRAGWNANLTDQKVNHFTDAMTIRKQASVFNNAGRIYAPRYRQATLFSFFDEEKSPNGNEALQLAYSDVKAAFQYYLAHYNQGRPFIVAGHSQGTFHATRLLRELVDQDPKLRRQLVAAYLIGFHVQPNEYQVLKPCQDSTQTNCYVAWNSVEWGFDYLPFQGGVAVNPLTWKTDTLAAPASLNLGGTPHAFNRLDTAVVDAKVHNGLVWLHTPKPLGYPRFLLPGRPELRHSFHIADYALYYMNIRQNAMARVRAYERHN